MSDEVNKWKYYIVYVTAGGYGYMIVNTPTPIDSDDAIKTLLTFIRQQTRIINATILNWKLLRRPIVIITPEAK